MTLDRLEILSSGTHNFCGIEFHVSPGVLIPRPETELLANVAAELVREVERPTIIDMCSGSGNIACTLGLKIPDATVYGSDLTAPGVRLAQRNVAKHSVGHRVFVHQGNMFEPLRGLELERSVDLVVCNPPYIPEGNLETIARELREHEPLEAFAAGPYGMSIIKQLLVGAAEFLRPGRPLCFEFGERQESMCKWLLDRSGLYKPSSFVTDSRGVPRVAVAIRK